MGLKQAKKVFIQALDDDNYVAIHRADNPGKNLLAQAVVDKVFVKQLVERTKGNEHTESLHHQDPTVTVHVFKPKIGTARWYVKGFYDGKAWFISVHK